MLAPAMSLTEAAYAGSRASITSAIQVRAVFPSSVREGGRLRVSGHVLGHVGKADVLLQRQVGATWLTSSKGRVGRGGVFRLRWRAPRDPTILTMRVMVVGRGKSLVNTAPRRIRVRAPVRVLKPAKLLGVPSPGADGIVRYRGPVAAKPGDILAAGISKVSPEGFLGEVVSAQRAGSETVLHTKPTSLIAVVAQGTIDAAFDSSRGLAPVPAKTARLGHRALQSAAGGLSQAIGKSFSCTGGASATLDGSVSLTAKAAFSVHWSLFHGVDRAAFTGTATASAQLGASVSAAGSCSLAKTPLLAEPWTLAPIEVQVGPIPVVLVPRIQVYISGSGALGAKVATDVHGSLSATAGLSYSNGAFTPIASNDLKFGYDPPTVSSSASLGGRIIPTLDLLLYGVAGPEVSFSTGLQFTADTSKNPWWTLTAPIDLNAALTIPDLGLGTGELNVYHHDFPIAQAPPPPSPPPPPPLPPPPPPPPADWQIGSYLVSPDLACTLRTLQDATDEFYTTLESPNDACGTFLALEGVLYGPAVVPAGSNLGSYTPWTPLAQTGSGSGAAGDPHVLLTTVAAGESGVQLIETDRWVDGGLSVETHYSLTATPGDTRSFQLYRAADCYVGESDVGYGIYDPPSQTVGCLRTLPDGAQVSEQLSPLAPAGASSAEDFYGNIWSLLASQQQLPDTCRCGEAIDDGVATSWGLELAGASPVSASSRFAFVPVPVS